MTGKPWENPGPAQAFYEHYRTHVPLRDQWVAMVRKLWGAPEHPGLELYPEIGISDVTLPATIDQNVRAIVYSPAQPTDDVFVYLHGGSWMTTLGGKYRAWAKYIAAQANCTVLAVDYRLAPEHPFPCALHDTVTALQYAYDHFTGQVMIGGDSAGGNLGGGAIHYCLQHNIRVPDKLLALCPMMDMHLEKYPSNAKFGIGNPFGDQSLLAFQRYCYVPYQKDWHDPCVSPLYGELDQFPYTLMVIAADDPLYDDNMAFLNKLKSSGVKHQVEIYEQMPHTFYMRSDLIPEQAEQANQDILKFIRS